MPPLQSLGVHQSGTRSLLQRPRYGPLVGNLLVLKSSRMSARRKVLRSTRVLPVDSKGPAPKTPSRRAGKHARRVHSASHSSLRSAPYTPAVVPHEIGTSGLAAAAVAQPRKLSMKKLRASRTVSLVDCGLDFANGPLFEVVAEHPVVEKGNCCRQVLNAHFA